MLKTIAISFLSVISFSLPSFAQSFSLDSVRAASLSAAEVPVPPAAAVPAPAEPKEWTIIYYSTTKDKLKRSFLSQLVNMKIAGSNEKVNVLVEGSFPMLMSDGSVSTPTARIAIGAPAALQQLEQQLDAFITPEGDIKEGFLPAFFGEVLSTEYNVDTGDWRRAAAFARWAKTNYPAKRYAFVLFGHGNGFFDPKKEQKNTLLDTDTRNYVTIPEMRLLMQEAGRMDILIMQSCLMQMAEQLWQVKDHAEVVVGSSELMWSSGYDFPGMIRLLADRPGIPAAELGAMLARSYVEKVKKGGKSGHASVIPTAALPGFAEKINAWCGAVMALKDRKLLYPAIAQVARFDLFGITNVPEVTPELEAQAARISYSGDILDFVRLVNESVTGDSPEAAAARSRGTELMEYITGTLVSTYAYHGKNAAGYDYSRAGGISAHFPQQAFLSTPQAGTRSRALETIYWDIPFARQTRWGDFLHWLYGHNVTN